MIATEVVDMDKMVAGFDPETFDPTAFAEGLMAEERVAQRLRDEADERRREEGPETERLRREILDVRTPMTWHDGRRHGYKLWLRREREVFHRLFEEAARRGEWSETEQSAVVMALNQVAKAVKALSDFDKARQEERFTDRNDERPVKDNSVLRARLVRWAASQPSEKRGELLRKKKIRAAQRRKIERGLIRARIGGPEAIAKAMEDVRNAFLDMQISEEEFVWRKAELKKRETKKYADVERAGYGAAKVSSRRKPSRNKKDKKRGKAKAATSARGGRK